MKLTLILILSALFLSPVAENSATRENCEGETVDGQRHGYWKCFYDDGTTMQQEGTYESGKKTGEWKFYHANGQLALSGAYIDDSEKGLWKVYNEAGEEVDQIDYGA